MWYHKTKPNYMNTNPNLFKFGWDRFHIVDLTGTLYGKSVSEGV